MLLPGHAYFLAKDEAHLTRRLRYELIPLLRSISRRDAWDHAPRNWARTSTGYKGSWETMARRRRLPESRTVYQWQRRLSSLLVLNDQGAPVRLSPEAFGITGRDRSWNSFAQNFLSANEPQLRAMEACTTLVPDADQIHLA